MANNKIFKIRGQKEKVSEEELIKMITCAYLKGEDYITTSDMKNWLKIKDTIYQFYLNGGKEND